MEPTNPLQPDIQAQYTTISPVQPTQPIQFRPILGWAIILWAALICLGIFSATHPEYKSNGFINQLYQTTTQEFGTTWGTYAFITLLIHSALLLINPTHQTKTVIINIIISYLILSWICLGLHLYNINYSTNGKIYSLLLHDLTGNINISKILYATATIIIPAYLYGRTQIHALLCNLSQNLDLCQYSPKKLIALAKKVSAANTQKPTTTPQTQTTQTTTPQTQTPQTQTPEIQTPEIQIPEIQIPEIQLPEIQTKPPTETLKLPTDTNLTNIFKDLKINSGIKTIYAIQGPKITRALIHIQNPADSTQKEKIISTREASIARQLNTQHITIHSNISYQNKGYIAIDYLRPQTQHQTIFFNDMVSTEFYTKAPGIPLIFGKDIPGKTIIHNLHNTYHILINGTTGSGKSTALHSLLISALLTTSPKATQDRDIEPLNIYIIDPAKRTAPAYKPLLGKNNYIQAIDYAENHTTTQQLLNHIKKLIAQREQHLEQHTYSNLQNLNQALSPQKRLPTILLIIEEYERLIDEIDQAVKDKTTDPATQTSIRETIRKILSNGRAVQIYLILGTQYALKSKIGSSEIENFNTILGMKAKTPQTNQNLFNGRAPCEKLAGDGDAYLLTHGNLDRIQAPYIDDHSLKALITLANTRGQQTTQTP